MEILIDGIRYLPERQTTANTTPFNVLIAKEKGHDFGKVIKLGHQVIGD